jgi:tRNA (cmo5U34)-methyltransferase
MTQPFTFAQRAEGFDTHIELSIRGYSNLIDDVLKLSEYFVEDDTKVVDIGCSTGKMLKAMINQNSFSKRASYIGIELEEEFVEEWSPRSDEWTPSTKEDFIPNLYFHNIDVRDYNFENCSFVSSIFTLMFMPPHQRETVIKNVYNGLNSGGAFVFSEKTMADSAKIQDIRTFTYYDYKRKSFTTDDIMDKEKTLRSMAKPNTREELLNMCKAAGFSKIESFWQNHAFVGFLAIK